MHTITCIRKHINLLPPGVPFATRHLLSYGSRESVDQALYRLVKQNHITRLARGIFVKPASDEKLPSVQEIAATKALAFGKKIFTHALDAAYKLGVTKRGNQQHIFAIKGQTRSFQSVFGKIILKGTTAKDAKLKDKWIGLIIRAVRRLGNNKATIEMLTQIIRKLGRAERKNLHYFMPYMPAWMSDNFAVDGLWGYGIWAAEPIRKDWHALKNRIVQYSFKCLS